MGVVFTLHTTKIFIQLVPNRLIPACFLINAFQKLRNSDSTSASVMSYVNVTVLLHNLSTKT